jgi:hypothetical protein
MNEFNFLADYLELQKGISFDSVADLGFGKLAFSKIDSKPFWNYLLVNFVLGANLKVAEKKLISLNRSPAFYCVNSKSTIELRKELESAGYKVNYEDSWLFWEKGKVDEAHFSEVKKVSNNKELELFLKIFDKCFLKDDPKNPYGELCDYLKLAKSAWLNQGHKKNLDYFIVFKKGSPVAVSSLTSSNSIGYISNVGSLLSVRGEGFGKAASLFCVQESIKRGNKLHCVATEESGYPFNFYKKIGFVKKFSSVCYLKQ